MVSMVDCRSDSSVENTDSSVDMALLSWHEAMKPALPLLKASSPTTYDYKFGKDHDLFQQRDFDTAKVEAAKSLQDQKFPYERAENGSGQHNSDIAREAAQDDSINRKPSSREKLAAITKHLSKSEENSRPLRVPYPLQTQMCSLTPKAQRSTIRIWRTFGRTFCTRLTSLLQSQWSIANRSAISTTLKQIILKTRLG